MPDISKIKLPDNNIYDLKDNSKASKVSSATSGNFAALDSNGDLVDSGHKHSDYLTEHQSLSNYVQKNYYATSSTAGLVSVDADDGIAYGDNGAIYINKADSSQIKAGSNELRPIVPFNQHEATFYGLANAAGDTTQTLSNNNVGEYTDEAKSAIRNMLEIDGPLFKTIEKQNIAFFNDGADNLPLKNYKIEFEPIQNLNGYDGHDSIDIISTGKNLAYIFYDQQVPSVLSGNLVTSGGIYGNRSNFIRVIPNTQYTLQVKTNVNNYTFWLYYTKNKNYIDYSGSTNTTNLFQTITIPENAQYIMFRTEGATLQDIQKFQFEQGSTSTTYEPYIGRTVSIDIKSIHGVPSYGGYLTVNENGSGTLVITKSRFFVEDFQDNCFTTVTVDTAAGITRFWLYAGYSFTHDHEIKSDFLSQVSTYPNEGEVYTISSYPNSMQVAMSTSLIGTTLSDIISYFKTNKNHTDNYFILDLISPVVYTFTAPQVYTLLNTNNIWADNGKISLSYYTKSNLSYQFNQLTNSFSTSSYNNIDWKEIIKIDNGIQGSSLKSCNIKMRPKQDLHGYTKPWICGSSKNLYNQDNGILAQPGGITFTLNNDKTMTISGTAHISAGLYYVPLPYELPANTLVTISLNNSTIDSRVGVRLITRLSDGNVTNWGTMVWADTVNKTETVSQTYNTNYINVAVKSNHDAVSGITLKIQVELGTSPTSWQPSQNICPIIGYDNINVNCCGKNLFNPTLFTNRTDIGITSSVTENKSIYLTGTPSDINRYNNDTDNIILPKGTYIISASPFTANIRQNTNIIDNNGIFISDGYTPFSISLNITSESEINVYENIQIEYGSIATAYEPYKGIITPINLSTSTSDTIYDGIYDIINGNLILNKLVITFKGTETFTSVGDIGNLGYSYNLPYTALRDATILKCSHFEYNSITNYSNATKGQFILPSELTSVVFFHPSFGNNADITGFKNWLQAQYQNGTPVQLIIPINTTLEYTNLTKYRIHILNGTNYIWSNADYMNISYPTSINSYINSKADKAINPTAGNFASLDSNGNLIDSEHNHNDYVTITDQHIAVFQGLAKAAGNNTQITSNNTIGNYVDEAKAAILHMLGIDAIIGNYEADTVSDQLYVANDLFIMNGKLYKATDTIVQGGTITPNSNCTQTTLLNAFVNADQEAY